MDPGHKARKNPSNNADLGFQAVGPALRIMQLNVDLRIREEEMWRQTYGYLPSLSWYSLCLPKEGWPGWVDLGGWLHTEIVCPPEE